MFLRLAVKMTGLSDENFLLTLAQFLAPNDSSGGSKAYLYQVHIQDPCRQNLKRIYVILVS